MLHYAWPGNVRELRTAVEHAVVLSRGEKITARDLPASLRAGPAGATPAAKPNALTLKEAEQQLIERALKETGGNRTLAARKIGMSRRTFHRKLHLYHLEGL
jgi:DNA-binding NtrC family response regulator